MSQDQDEVIAPYRILFPLGILAGSLGLLLWILFQIRGINFYPRMAHSNLMYFGFLWSFVAGFLMTAVPKMTGAKPAHIAEIGAAAFLVFLQMAFNLRNSFEIPFALLFLQTLFLLIFLLRRFLVKRKIPFEGFVFIPFAFVQVFLGLALNVTGKSELFYLFVGEAFMLNLIFGLGSRLIPVLSRIPNALAPDVQGISRSFQSTLAWALFLNLSFWMQLYDPKLGLILKLLFIGSFSILRLKILKRPQSFSVLAIGFRLSVVFLILSCVLQLIPAFPVLAAQHLSYVGGLTIITLMVASRVMLAHGGASLDYELSSKRLGFVLASFCIAAILRLFAGVDIVGSEMRISLYLMLVGMVLWVYKFVKILWLEKSST